MDVFISEREACKLLGLKKETLRKHCNAGKYNFKFTKKGNKKYFRIDLFSLPKSAQDKFWDKIRKKGDYLMNGHSNEQLSKNLIDYADSPDWKRKKADKYFTIMNY